MSLKKSISSNNSLSNFSNNNLKLNKKKKKLNQKENH